MKKFSTIIFTFVCAAINHCMSMEGENKLPQTNQVVSPAQSTCSFNPEELSQRLLDAIYVGDLESIKNLLAQNADPSKPTSEGKVPLIIAHFFMPSNKSNSAVTRKEIIDLLKTKAPGDDLAIGSDDEFDRW